MSAEQDRAATASSSTEHSGEGEHQTMQSPEQQNFSSSDSEKPHPTLSDASAPGGEQPTSRRDFMKMRRPSSPNATSAPITQASGPYTGGVVNRHPNSEAVHEEITSNDAQSASSGTPAGSSSKAENSANNDLIAFRVGVSEDRNQKCRRTMEDSHAFVYDFAGVKVCYII
jgi:protein phosphatase PTC1